MTYVVTDNCIQCKYTDCVDVCPVDCFYEGPNFLVINPDECIDCDDCVEACPAGAIFNEDDLPDDKIQFFSSTKNSPKSGLKSLIKKSLFLMPKNGMVLQASLNT